MATHSSILTWEIPIDQGAWWATVHGVTKSQTPGTDGLSTSTHTDYSRTDTLNGGWEWTLSPKKPQNRSIPLSLKEYSRVHGETKVSQGFYHNMAHRIDLRQQESTLITEALYNQSVQPQQKHYKGTFMKPSLPLRFFSSSGFWLREPSVRLPQSQHTLQDQSWEDRLQSGRQGPTLHIARPVRAASLSILLPPADLKWLIRLGESGNRNHFPGGSWLYNCYHLYAVEWFAEEHGSELPAAFCLFISGTIWNTSEGGFQKVMWALW